MTNATNTTTLPGLPEAFYKCKGSFGAGVERFEMVMPGVGMIRRRLVVLVRTSPSATWYVGAMELPGVISQQCMSTDWEHVLKFVEEVRARG